MLNDDGVQWEPKSEQQNQVTIMAQRIFFKIS